MRHAQLWLVGLLAGTACGDAARTEEGAAAARAVVRRTGAVEGRLELPESARGAPARASAAPGLVPGEIIVRLEPGSDLASLLARHDLRDAGPIYPGGPRLLRARGERSEAATEQLARRLRAERGVRYAHPNHLVRGGAVPDDPAYVEGWQWPLRLMRLPLAWEVTTGSADVIVAVVDSGVIPQPDLEGRLVPGFDFVSRAIEVGDGDALDDDATDPTSLFRNGHGTAVAGIIAARGDDGAGMSGVAWDVRIMPVRILGITNLLGSIATMLNGIRFAAGLENSSGRVPERRASVINLSLTGRRECTEAEQEVFEEVRELGIVVVAGAGNEAENGNPRTAPGSCEGVIAVGAVDPKLERAPYSNHHPYVLLAAPGGLVGVDTFDAVVSTLMTTPSGRGLYLTADGTSFAAPHVSGVVALMLAASPGLTVDEVETILAETAIDRGPAGRDDEYGFGFIDAGAAVARAAGVDPPPVPVPYPLRRQHVFSNLEGPAMLDTLIINVGTAPLVIGEPVASVEDPQGATWLTAARRDHEQCGDDVDDCLVSVTADPAGLAEGLHVGHVHLETNGGELSLRVSLRIGPPRRAGTVTVRLLGLEPGTRELAVLATTTTDAARDFRYAFLRVPPGVYLVEAGVDDDDSGVFGDARYEYRGAYSPRSAFGTLPVSVRPGRVKDGVDFFVGPPYVLEHF